MTELKINEDALNRTIERCREKNIIIPTFEQQKNPEKVPDKIKEGLKDIGLWDVHPSNLFRITWKNNTETGLFGGVNYVEVPHELTGVDARIIGLVGKWFPTGAHKVGAAFGCLVPRLVTGNFDPTKQKAVWPSTGNYCRGGAYDSSLLGCQSISILPEEMSKERFEWLKEIGSEVIATPGCESNVKEIFDKCWELRKSGQDLVILNQFEEFGNPLWHHEVTGSAIEEVLGKELKKGDNYFGYCIATGSAGTLGAGEYLKKKFPRSKIIANEALQCPTLLMNGFGAHRIEGIGDKHVPWVHNVRNTDMIVAVDDNNCMALMRLFNEEAGQEFLKKDGISEEFIEKLPLMGISSIANLLASIKAAKYYELGESDVIVTVFTDSMEMYGSRLDEARKEHGEYTAERAARHYERYLQGLAIDYTKELGYYGRKRIHNLKYFTWIEQQGRDIKELNEQWNNPEYWENHWKMAPEYDKLIKKFNERTGLEEK